MGDELGEVELHVHASFRGTEAGYGAELALNEVRIASGQNQIAADELAKFAAQNPPAFYASGAAAMMRTVPASTI